MCHQAIAKLLADVLAQNQWGLIVDPQATA